MKTVFTFVRVSAAVLTVGIGFVPAGAPSAQTPPPGKITIGVAIPKAQLGQGSAGADVAEPLRRSLMTQIQGPSVDVVSLDSQSPGQIDAEALAKHCNYILYSSMEQKSGGGGLGFLKKMAPFTSALPMLGGMSHGGGAALGNIASELAQSAASASAAPSQQEATDKMAGAQHSGVKSGDAITIEYHLTAPGSAQPARADKLSAKASSDGQDLLTGLTAQIASAVVNAAARSSGALAGSGAAGHESKSPMSAGQMDCDKLSGPAAAYMSADTCRKMMGAQASYQTAANDPSAQRAGDASMSCEQIAAEITAIGGSGPSAAHRDQATVAVNDLNSAVKKENADAAARGAADQAIISAAAASDKATQAATGGAVNPGSAGKVEQVLLQQEKIENQQAVARLQPKMARTTDSLGGVAQDLGNSAASNPRYARLIQLAGQRNCHAPAGT